MSAIFAALSDGLPLLLGHFLLAAGLLAAGAVITALITPWKEMALIRAGNVAAATILASTVLALTFPVATTLAHAHTALDIVVWGVVGVVVQLAVYAAATLLIRDLRTRIEDGQIATAILLAGWQIAVGLLNAAALAG